MANKRVSELSLITAGELAPNDLFCVADVSAFESKKMYASQLGQAMQSYVSSSLTMSVQASATASLSRTASFLIGWTLQSGTAAGGTASCALTSSFNITSSHALWTNTASNALAALSASYASRSFYAQTASFAWTSSYVVITQYSSAYASNALTASVLFYPDTTGYIGQETSSFIRTGIVYNGTASHAMYSDLAQIANVSTNARRLIWTGGDNGIANLAINAQTSSFLVFTQGVNNGTASMAMSASWVPFRITSSYLFYNGIPNGTAHSASRATYASSSVSASYAKTASYLVGYNPASIGGYLEGGPYDATVYNITPNLYATTTASFGTLNVNPTDGIAKRTVIEVWGDLYTDGQNNHTLTLQLVQGATVTPLESQYLQLTGSTNQWYFKVAPSVLGSWEVRVINSNLTTGVMVGRTPKMYIKTLSDNFSVT